MRFHSRVLSLAFAVCAAGASVGAQAPVNAAPSGAVVPTRGALGPRPDLSSDIEITLPSVTVSGAPRSYQVVSIPVPDALANASNVEVEIVPRGDFVVLGARNRSFSASATKRVGITIGIPASALAGRLIAAEARFSSGGSAKLVVPVEIVVSLVRRIVLHPGTVPINGQAGSDVIVPFEIMNSGNARENVSAELTLPDGWSSRELRQMSVTLEPGETIRKRIRLSIPPLSSTGSSFVHIVLRAEDELLGQLKPGDEILGDETMTVEVFNSSSIGSQAGPMITTSVAHANDETGRPNSLVSLSATGALFDSVRVDARMSRGSALGGAASNAFAHLGSFQSSASLALSSPSGQLNFGNTGTSFSDLTGLYPYGEGALVHVQHPEWSFTGLGALSVIQPGLGKRKPMIGIKGGRQLGDVQLSSSITHLADAGSSPRQLDAVGVGAAVPSLFGTTFKAEIAERRFQDGSGLGWSTGLFRTAAESSEEFRVTHAPGGSDAFARATNEVVGNVSERLTTRASVSASAWRTTDATSVFSGLNAKGLSLRPQYALLPSTTLSIEARSYVFDATSRPTASNAGGGFGNREQQLGISLSTYLRQYYLNSSAYLGNVTRTVTPVGQSVITDRTPRNYWTTNAGWSGVGGILELQTRIEQTRDRGGFVNQQSMVGVRGEQVVLPWFGGVRAEGELQRVNGFGDEKSSIVRTGLAVPIVNGLAFKIDAERNSIFHSLSGHVPWIVGVRFEHSLTVPMLRQPGTSGYVYEDTNGNDHRDSGEPGVAGAMVRRGGVTAVADASGKYRVGGDARQPVTIDEASLPDGWTASGATRGDLSVSLSTSAEVELVVASRSGISDVVIDLAKARVLARDSVGREWVARMTGPTTATFEALPVGTYTLEFDLSDLTEPLVPRAPVSVLRVTGKDSKSITVTLDPRPIRMWNGSAPKGSNQKKSVPPAGDKGTTPPPGVPQP
ncbi:MAG TPA: NEW3 domain-containing protein [Gemmatimonadaceae bacterium]